MFAYHIYFLFISYCRKQIKINNPIRNYIYNIILNYFRIHPFWTLCFRYLMYFIYEYTHTIPLSIIEKSLKLFHIKFIQVILTNYFIWTKYVNKLWIHKLYVLLCNITNSSFWRSNQTTHFGSYICKCTTELFIYSNIMVSRLCYFPSANGSIYPFTIFIIIPSIQ